ncbi:ABC transporter ATP-binding protein/permease [Betaproteobacteria bacterium]|nr:ABC transporter ATP-binding protein/permease [Betaproteobacteria bacterium]
MDRIELISMESKNFLNVIQDFLPFFLKFKGRMILALFALIGAKATLVSVPIIFKYLVDHVSDSESATILLEGFFYSEDKLIYYPIFLIVIYGVLRFLSTGFAELREFVFVKVTYNAVSEIALKVFQNLHQLSLSFHLSKKTGSLTRELERGIRGISTIVNFTLYSVLPTFFEVIFVASWLAINYEPFFAIIILSTIFLYAIFTIYVTNWRIMLRRNMNESDAEANATVVDSLMNYETVKYFNNEEFEEDRYKNKLLIWQKAAEKSQGSLSVLNLGQAIIISFSAVLILLLAYSQFTKGFMTIGDLVLINAFLIQLFLPLNFLGVLYRELKQSLVDIEKMFGLINEEPDIKDRANVKTIPDSATLNFENVSFSYGSRLILKDLNFTLQPGRTTAIVGYSGGGKSTISKLLYRFYDVTSGRITYGGIDIRDLSQSELRSNIAVVPQDPVLFNESLEYNLRYGYINVQQDDLRKVIQLANLDNFISSLPLGIQTIVGERGLKLSGGEKQRVAIARALLKQPKIMIFDEATSALDSKTEKAIQSAILAISAEKTCLIIAHRLSTIISAHEILVLDKGVIIQKGTHEDLLKTGGKYTELWSIQSEEKP